MSGPVFSAAQLAEEYGVLPLPVSVLLDTPTGSGKTWTAQRAAQHTLQAGGKVIVITPLRALADELAQVWATSCAPHTVQAYTRDHPRPKRYAAASVLVMTPERLDLITRQWRRHHGWLAQVRLIVADELQLIGDPQRGPHYEGALSRVRSVLPLCRVLAMTATCGNAPALARWLGALHLHSAVRPIPLTWEHFTVRAGEAKEAKIRAVVEAGLAQHHQLLLFVRSRARASEWATRLCAAGVAAQAHHAGLTPEERRTTEAAFRAGALRVICCTGTLELGLNLPCDQVVLADLSRYQGGDWERLPTNTVWQRAGRAGRNVGQAARVSLIGTRHEQPAAYTRSAFEPVLSQLHGVAQLGALLGDIEAGLIRQRAQAERCLSRRLHPPRQPQRLLDELLASGALEEDDHGLRLTALGRVASDSLLDVATVAAHAALPNDPCAFDYFLLLAPGLRPPLTLRDADAGVLRAVLTQVPSRRLDAGTPHSRDTLLTAALLHAACELGDAEAAKLYGAYPFQLTTLREEAARVVAAWQRLNPTAKGRLVRAMLETGLNLDAASLTLIHGVGHVRAQQLAAQGVRDLEDLAQCDLHVVRAPRRQVERWQNAAARLVKTFDTDPTREPPASVRPTPLAWDTAVDPQRLRRALHLSVQPEAGGYRVSGGERPHFVSASGHCDCPDQVRVHLCKHLLAVKLFAKESHFWGLAQQLDDGAGEST